MCSGRECGDDGCGGAGGAGTENCTEAAPCETSFRTHTGATANLRLIVGDLLTWLDLHPMDSRVATLASASRSHSVVR